MNPGNLACLLNNHYTPKNTNLRPSGNVIPGDILAAIKHFLENTTKLSVLDSICQAYVVQ